MRGAGIAIQESRSSGQQGAGANRHQSVPRANAGSQPVDNGALILAYCRLSHIVREGNFIRRSGDDDHRPRGYRTRQGLNVRKRNADGGHRSGTRSYIVNIELKRALFDIRTAQNFHRPSDIEEQYPLGQHDPDIENGWFSLDHAARRPASLPLASNADSASAAVSTRAKRPSRTSSVRALMSAAVQWRPWRSVMAKVSVASLTKSTS